MHKPTEYILKTRMPPDSLSCEVSLLAGLYCSKSKKHTNDLIVSQARKEIH